MKQFCGLFLGILLAISLGNCGTERPIYELGELQGHWRRVRSNNLDADSMLLQIEGNSAVILYAPPNSNYSNNELKWTSIAPVISPRDFTLSDKSVDGTRWAADLFVEQFDGDSIQEFTLKSSKFLAAPGGEQTWVRE
ncbi:MAG: hypothetical protein ACRBFS_18475 [Aureispira sp.]